MMLVAWSLLDKYNIYSYSFTLSDILYAILDLLVTEKLPSEIDHCSKFEMIIDVLFPEVSGIFSLYHWCPYCLYQWSTG